MTKTFTATNKTTFTDVCHLSKRPPFRPAKTGQQRFLSGAHRPSTLAIGEALWSRLKDGPAVVNVSQVARETGYSRPTVYRSLAFFERFLKAFPVASYSTGDSPGRPLKYQLNPAYTAKPQENSVISKRVNPSITPQYKTYDKESFSRNINFSCLSKRTKGKNLPSVDSLNIKILQLTDNKHPTERDKRLLMAAVRKLFDTPKPVQDGICSQIARQRNRTNADWKQVLRLMWRGCQLVSWDDPEREAPGGGVWRRYLSEEIPERSDHRAYFSYWARVVRFALRGFGLSRRLDSIESLESAMISALQRETTVAEEYRFLRYRLSKFTAWVEENEFDDPANFDTWYGLKAQEEELESAMAEGLGCVENWRIIHPLQE